MAPPTTGRRTMTSSCIIKSRLFHCSVYYPSVRLSLTAVFSRIACMQYWQCCQDCWKRTHRQAHSCENPLHTMVLFKRCTKHGVAASGGWGHYGGYRKHSINTLAWMISTYLSGSLRTRKETVFLIFRPVTRTASEVDKRGMKLISCFSSL